jgi:excinuclease ABC subunit C
MEEVLTRRLSALLAARAETRGEDASAGSARARRFAYPPQLLLLDGGKGQLGVGIRVLERLGLSEEIPVAALAKTFEEVFVPGRSDPVPIPRGSDALFLLQRVRDEAHRFAVSYHRNLRGRRMTRSALEGVPGLGPARRTRLLREFGSLRALRLASLEDLRGLAWLPDAVAVAVHAHLHSLPPRAPIPGSVTPLAPGLGQDGRGPGADPDPAPDLDRDPEADHDRGPRGGAAGPRRLRMGDT